MKYYKYEDKYVSDKAITYIEVEEGYAQRQITADGNFYISSNINDIEQGLVLAEGYCDNDFLDNVIKIEKDEFDCVWQKILNLNKKKWDLVKNRNKIGEPLNGYIYRIFPQGVIVIIDKNTLGLVDYQKCIESAKDVFLISYGHPIISTVVGYDEENQWLILSNPQISQNHLDYDELMQLIYGSKKEP